MAGIDQAKGLQILNGVLNKLGIYEKGKVEGDFQDFTSIFASAEDLNDDGQIDVKEFAAAAAGYAEYNFSGEITDDKMQEIEEAYASAFEKLFGEDGASAAEISNLSRDAGSAASAGGYQSDDTTMEDVKTRFQPTVQEANTENMSLADMKSNLATAQQALADKQSEIQETQAANEEAYTQALEEAAESNKVLADLKDQRDEKEGLVENQNTIIADLTGEIENQTSIIETQEGIIGECEAVINQPIPSPVRDPETGEITNQAEIDKVKADIEAAKAKKAEAEAAKETAEQNKLDLEGQKVTAEEQKLVLEAEIVDIDKQVENEIKNNTELEDLAQKLEAYQTANMEIMSMEADRVQLEKNINIYEKAIAEAEAAQDPVTEKEATGLREDSDTLKGEDGKYQYDVKEDDSLETVVENNYDIAALVEATGLERSEVIEKLADELNTANAVGDSGVIYPGTTLSMVDAYSVLGIEDKRPAVTEGVNPNEKRDLDDTQIDGVVSLLLGDLDIDGIDIDPQEAWNNHDFSQYTPETLAKIAAAYEERVGAADVSFLEMAELNIEAEDKLADIAGGLIAAANGSDVDPAVKARANEMVNAHIDKALESGDPTFLQAIINSPEEYLNDVKEFIEGNGLVDKLDNSEHAEISGLRDAMIDKQKQIYVSDEMQAQIDNLLSDDPAVAQEAWNAIDLSNPDAIADLQQAYDAQKQAGDPPFLEKAAEMYGATEMDEILAHMDKLPEDPAEIAGDKITINGQEKTVEDIVEDLQNNKDFSVLADLPAEDVAKIAKVYGNLERFEFFMQQQGISEGSTEYTDVRRAIETRDAEIAEKEAEYAYNDAIDDAYSSIEQKIEDFNASNGRLSTLDGDNAKDPSEIYDEINSAINDPNLSPAQKYELLERLSENESFKPYVQGYLTSDDYSSEEFVSTMLDGCTSPEQAVEFASWYNNTVGAENPQINEALGTDDNIGKIVALYQNATPEEISQMNTSFNIPTLLTTLDADDAKKILDAIASVPSDLVPTAKLDDGSVDEFLESEYQQVRDSYLRVDDGWDGLGIFADNDSKLTITGILEDYNSGQMTKETAMWLLNEAQKSPYNYNLYDLYTDDCTPEQRKIFLRIYE